MAGVNRLYRKLDFVVIVCYILLIGFGWINIYSSSAGDESAVFDITSKYGMHLIWIGLSLFTAALILFVISPRIYTGLAWPLFILMVLLLISVVFIGVEVNGSKSWIALGSVRIQPSEFSKITTALALAYVMSKHDFSFNSRKNTFISTAIMFAPIIAILLEKETGSALVYLGFLLVFFCEGMTPWVLLSGLLAILLFILSLLTEAYSALLVWIGISCLILAVYSNKHIITLVGGALMIVLLSFLPSMLNGLEMPILAKFPIEMCIGAFTVAVVAVFAVDQWIRHKIITRNILAGYIVGVVFIFSVQFIFNEVLKEHQRARIETLLGIREDPMGVGYNVHQSLIAIGSGGVTGKGFLHGTQTRFDFVPEQSTDFIFCTIGEEWGFVGCMTVLILYLIILLRIMNSAEKQKDRFTRVYGYCVASILLMHVVINISMTIGLMPVIGIPLPFLSYGGSSLLAFTILLFIYLRLDIERWK